MNAPTVMFYLISVGVLGLASLHAALMAHSTPFVRACWVLSAVCTTFALYQFCGALQYAAPDQETALAAHRWMNLFGLLITPLTLYLVAALDAKKHSLIAARVVMGLVSLVIIDNFTSAFGYRFSALYASGPTRMLWGEQLSILSGPSTVACQLLRLLNLAVLVYSLIFSVRISGLAGLLWSRLVCTAISIMFVTCALTWLSDIGLLKLPYLSGFGFTFLAAALPLLIRSEARNRRAEALRISSALENAVKKHTLANQRFEHVLHNDPLTNLPNRAGAVNRLYGLLEHNLLNQTRLAVLMFDLDRLGVINGMRGHKAGDQLLIEVAERLQLAFRDSDLIARLDGGSFMVGASGLNEQHGVALIYDKLLEALEPPFEVADRIIKITLNTGISVFPDDGQTVEDILAAAELALHDAKSSGPGHIRIFDPSLKENLQQRIDFESALKEALEKEQFFLCYQPQVASADGRTVCMEALIRWQHPVYGLVMPDKFIPLAESTGIINAIGAWVIDTACQQLACWHAMGFSGLKVAVNLSAQQLLVKDLEATVSDALGRAGLRGGDLELEITESVLMQDPERSIERLGALRKLGVRLSIDDFGTGYSSLGYLRVLPVHAFKLDRSFVRDIGKSVKDLEICATAIGLAKNLGLEIVAEGVETKAQMQQLRELGCHLLQGYLFARPLSVEAVAPYLLASPQIGTALLRPAQAVPDVTN
jgi:diguanylate cyclase (GGDEF)-like protein